MYVGSYNTYYTYMSGVNIYMYVYLCVTTIHMSDVDIYMYV